MMAPSASASSAIKTLVRVTAFGLGVTYGGYRLATLKQRKFEEEEEKHKKDIQDAVSKALAAREELTLKPKTSSGIVSSSGSLFPSDEGEYIVKWLELLDSDPAFDLEV